MGTEIFRCTALVLSMALGVAPTAADYCAVTCETAHVHGAASSLAHAGHHHHAASPLASIDQAPQPCGHDHSGIVGVESNDGAAPARPFAPAALMPTNAEDHRQTETSVALRGSHVRVAGAACVG